jgi:hypothetical protein
MSTVRCKVRLSQVVKQEYSYWDHHTGTSSKSIVNNAKFGFVTAGDGDGKSEENKRFWEATPSGTFEVSTSKEMPWSIGEEFYVDIVPVVNRQ